MKKLNASPILRALCVIIALCVTVTVTLALHSRTTLRLDVTDSQMMTPTTETRTVIDTINEDVDIWYMATETGEISYLSELIRNMAAQNSHLTAHILQANETPQGIAPATLTAGNIVVTSARRSVTFTESDMHNVQIDQMAYYYTQQVSYTAYDFIAQDKLCNALIYVTRDDLPVVYALSGHGELADDGSFGGVCFDMEVDFRALTLQPGETVPADASALIVSNPGSDIGTDTAKALNDYLDAGGRILLLTGHSTTFGALQSITDRYGLARVEGLVLDSAQGAYLSADYPMYLYPQVADEDLKAAISEAGGHVVLPICEAISVEPTDGITVRTLFTTTDQGYRKPDANAVTSMTLEEGDEKGTFTLGVTASDKDGLRLAWITAPYAFQQNGMQVSTGGNAAVIRTLLGAMVGDILSQRVEIAGIDMMVLPPSFNQPLMIILLLIPPVALLIVGLIRRKKFS